MKFPTQHKRFVMNVGSLGKKEPFFAHRDGKYCWLNRGVETATIFTKTFNTVRDAKAWMNSPKISK